MELLLSKQRILELYLNHIEFGPASTGSVLPRGILRHDSRSTHT
jgi:membrane peptidoglycan carboxypeptidase